MKLEQIHVVKTYIVDQH